MIMNIIQEPCIHLFLIYRLVNYQIFQQNKIIFLKTFKSDISYIGVRFTDQNSKPLEIEDKIELL